MLITTSRDPTHHLRRVSKIISLSIPNSQRMNRGSLSLHKLFTYCWNKQISRLLILQETTKENEKVLVKAYLIGKIPQLIDATVELTDIISLQRQRKKHRITIEKVYLDFSVEVNKIIKERITDFFQYVAQDSNHIISAKNYLTISFRKKNSTSVIGQAVQQNSSKLFPLFNIHISSECVNNEY